MSPVFNVYSTSVSSENFSRHELLAWVNDCLQCNLTKIEEMATAAAYSQLTDFLFPGKIPLKKIKWNSRSDVDWLNNWRVLQHAWKEIGIDKPVPIQSLMRAKFQDNFEFLQWFKKFFDANYDGHEYDPLAARNYEEFPATLPGGCAKKPPSVPAAARRIVVHQTKPPQATVPTQRLSARESNASNASSVAAQSRARTAQASKPTTATSTTRRPSPRTATTTTSATPPARPNLPRASPNSGPRLNGTSAAGGGGKTSNAVETNKMRQQLNALEAQNADLINKLDQERAKSELFERERAYYYDKLRAIEILCGACSGGSMRTEEVQAILWERNESAASSAVTINNGARISPQPRGDIAVQPRLESPDSQQLHEMMINCSTQGASENPSGDAGCFNTAHLEDTFLLDDSNEPQADLVTVQQPMQTILDLSEEKSGEVEKHRNETYNADQMEGRASETVQEKNKQEAESAMLNTTHPVATTPVFDGTFSKSPAGGGEHQVQYINNRIGEESSLFLELGPSNRTDVDNIIAEPQSCEKRRTNDTESSEKQNTEEGTLTKAEDKLNASPQSQHNSPDTAV